MDPEIIQGGLGAGVSGWRLARAVTRRGQLGVVSGTGIDNILVRRLHDGDPGGHYRRALEAFPIPSVASEVLRRFFRPEESEVEPYPGLPLYTRALSAFQEGLLVLANFAEVFLAREGHDGPIGVNYLTKIQMPNLPSLYGAMLAGVSYVLMGAGIPREVPGVLDQLSLHQPVSFRMEMQGGTGAEDERLNFDPGQFWETSLAPLKRPKFFPIVASNSLATMMARKSNGSIEGFVIEGPTAGGHNAPPRGGGSVNERGEPQYGERDVVDLEKLKELGLPFWIAGGAGNPNRLREAKAAGARGVQVGTLFAYCEESGLEADLKQTILDMCKNGGVDVVTDGRASPTGFPFKSVSLAGSISEAETYEARTRVCDLGYLRTPFRKKSGGIGFRCASEPEANFINKGGDPADLEGRKCLCNALMANIGIGQLREEGTRELPLVTSGDDLTILGRFLGDRSSYSADDVLDYLLSEPGQSPV